MPAGSGATSSPRWQAAESFQTLAALPPGRRIPDADIFTVGHRRWEHELGRLLVEQQPRELQCQSYPLILTGGFGLKHGRCLRLAEGVPLVNVLVTLLDRLNVPAGSFADNTGALTEVLA